MKRKLLFLVVSIFCGIVARSQINGNNHGLHYASSNLNNQWNIPGNGINGLPTGAPNWNSPTFDYGLDEITPCTTLYSSTLEDGLGDLTGLTLAADFTVAANDVFEIEKVNLIMFNNVNQVNVSFYENNAGFPGATILAPTTITPDAITLIGTNVYLVELTLPTSVTLDGGASGSLYWLGVSSIASNASYWIYENTAYNGTYFRGLIDGAWVDVNIYGFPVDGAFSLEGNCGVEDEQGCLDTPNGQWGYYTPACTGLPELVASTAWTGEYSYVVVTAGTPYVFSTSVNTDYITIANNAGTQIYVSGTGSVSWTPSANETIRFINHLNSDCDYSSISRNRYVACGDIIPPPSNDECANAIAVNCGDTITGSTSAATNSGGSASPDVFYKYNGNGTPGDITVSLCGSSYDTLIRIYSDCTLATQITSNDDFCGAQSEVTFASDGTSTYFIMVEGWSTSAGAYTMNVTCDLDEPEPCLDTPNGAWGSLTPACTGSPELITSIAYTGEYSSVTVTAGTEYIFSSSVNTDFITIANNAGTVAYTAGVTPLTWTATSNETIRFIMHNNADCDYNSTSRSKFVQCGEPLVIEEPDFPCFFGDGLASNGPEDGLNVSTGANYRTADDFTVTENFTVKQVRFNVLSMTPVVNTTLNFRSNNSGTPGAVIESRTMAPSNSRVVGGAFGYTLYEVTFDLATFIELSAGTYWFDPHVTSTDGSGSVYWDATSTGTTGAISQQSSDGGATWAANQYGYQQVFFVAGECNPVQEEEPCLDTPNGAWGSLTPACTGSPELITSIAYTGEYSSVTVTAGTEYIFSSSVNTDFITIANNAGTVAYTAGVTPLTWTATSNETIRFIMHNNADCDYNSTSRSKFVQCGEPLVIEEPDFPCFFGDGLASNGPEDGLNVSTGANYRTADDFTVTENFTVKQVRFNVLSMTPVVNTTLNFRSNNSGTPGAVIESRTMAPSNSRVVGGAFGYTLYEVTFDLATFIELSAGTYWFDPHVTSTDGSGSVYWDATSTGTTGAISQQSSDGGATWAANQYGYQQVFFVAGECNPVQEEEPCLDTPNGAWGSLTPACTGSPEIITGIAYTGEYSNVTVTAGTQYIFSSSVNTDFITIANTDGTIAYAAGVTPLTWTATSSETVRFIMHNNADCEYDSNSRSKYVTCGDILPPPPNDDCANAIAVSCGDSVTGSTSSANNSGGNPAGDVFYKFTGTGTAQEVTVSLCGSTYDTYLRVFTDCTLSTQIAFNDDFCGTQSELSFMSDGTSTYYIMVEGFSSNTGNFVMNISCDDNGGGYCEPDLDCTDGDLITNVTFQEIDNDTACSPNGYGNYTHLVATGAAGESYPISVTVGSGWSNESVSVWVDYNNNFVFEESEFTYVGTGSGSDVTGSIAIPAGTANGQYRMRVRVAAVGAVSATWDMACDETQVYGETEDYTLQVGESTGEGCEVEYVGTLQDGIGNLQALQIANDFTVAAQTEMTIMQVQMRIFADINTGSIYIYKDNGGVPGDFEGSAENITPTSKTFVNNTFGFNVYDVVFDLPTPIIVETGATQELFWVGLTTTAGTEGGSNFWEAADATTNGLAMVSTDGGISWVANSFGQDSAFKVSGECQLLGLSDMSSYDFAYYPNPAKDILNISSSKPVQSVQVFNLAGQNVMSNGKIANGQINISTLMTGTYVFRVTLEGGQVETFKIIKK
jgi:hypothetical protein